MIDPRFREALRKAHVDGDGEAVADIWRKIADDEISVEETLAWAKTVADWITETNEPLPSREPEGEPMPFTRVDRIHAALTVAGWVEPTRDSLSDEYHLLKFATKYSNVQRTAATAIWQLIHRGKASQRTREEWLDYVAKGITEAELPDGANRRGDAMLKPIGLKGHEHGQLEVLVKILLQWMVALRKDAYSKSSRSHTVSLRKRLQAINVIPEDITEEEEKKWERIIRDEKLALKITSK
jgi:hypothetical protein